MSTNFEADKKFPTHDPLEIEPLHQAPVEVQAEENPEASYTVEVAEAADLLGVSRTRLSQLTTKGVFSFERRKIETRNRLFYSKDELLRYMRGQQVRVAGASADASNIRWNATRAWQVNSQLNSQLQSQLQSQLPSPLHLHAAEELELQKNHRADTYQQESSLVSRSKSVSQRWQQKHLVPRLPSAQSLSLQDAQAIDSVQLSTQVENVQNQLEHFNAELSNLHLDFSEVKKNLRQVQLATARIQLTLLGSKPEANTLPAQALKFPQGALLKSGIDAPTESRTHRGLKKRSAQSTAKAKLFK